jgi:hypothetical protein
MVANQLIGGKHPIIILCRVSTIQGGAGVHPSTVGLKGQRSLGGSVVP